MAKKDTWQVIAAKKIAEWESANGSTPREVAAIVKIINDAYYITDIKAHSAI